MSKKLYDITNKKDFAVMSALRGPDASKWRPSVKFITTAVIRYFAGVTSMAVVVVEPEEVVAYWCDLTIEERQKIARHLWYNKHFYYHVMSGLESVDHPDAKGYALWLTRVIEENLDA